MVDIPRDTIDQMFDRMRHKYRWDTDAPLVWGYFFVGKNMPDLESAAELLVQSGYEFVGIFPMEKELPDEIDQWWLHVERVEHHTVDSLAERNARLNEFSAANRLLSYDGMEAGPVPPPQ